MSERISLEVSEGVADVRLNRPDKMNALDPAMFEAINSTIDHLSTLKGLRAVVLSGEGKAFCAGMDFISFAAMAGASGLEGIGDIRLRTHGMANRFQQVSWGWRTLPVPVIAALHGTAFGGGFQIALGADLRLAHPDTKLSVMEIKWGLVPDMAGTQLMRHLAREDVVRELTYTGRVFDAREGQALGFVTRLADDPRAEALRLAREIAGKSPDAIRAAKRLLNAAVTDDPLTGLTREAEEQRGVLGGPNQSEAVFANMQKRAPVFRDS